MSEAAAVIRSSGIKFGTSGARGLVEQFTHEVCVAFTTAFVNAIRERNNFDMVVVGIDRRPSSPEMAAACIGAIGALGLQFEYYGVIPTPAVALAASKKGAAAIVITGSHIPFDRNGIKFYRPDGEIDKSDEVAILESSVALPDCTPVIPDVSNWAADIYISRYLDLFGKCLSGKKIGVYEHSAAGREINVHVLREMGAEVVSLGKTDTFIPIDTEAVSEEDQQQAYSWSKEYGLDAILSTDGDGDRPLISDETGLWFRGDILGLLCAKELGISSLAVPVSCNSAIESCGFFDSVTRTRIGSPYVIEAMEELSGSTPSVAGFEANGGFLLGSTITVNGVVVDALPTRDALLPALVLISASAKRAVPLSGLLSGLPERFTASDRLTEIDTAISRELIEKLTDSPDQLLTLLKLDGELVGVNTIDGFRATLSSGNVVHLRPSGNAPELRCYVEAGSLEAALELKHHCLGALSSYVSSIA